MPQIEIVAYLPKYMKEFLFFCVNGAPDGHGGWLPDEYGRLKTGVFEWLYGREVPEAHFYTSDPADPVQLFAATIHRLEPKPKPWMKDIAGFDDLLVHDGEVGSATSFPPLNQPLASLRSVKQLDDIFEDGRKRMESILRLLRDPSKKSTLTAEAFTAALRGEIGTDLSSMLEEIRTL